MNPQEKMIFSNQEVEEITAPETPNPFGLKSTVISLLVLSLLGVCWSYFSPSSAAKQAGKNDSQQLVVKLAAEELRLDQDITSRKLQIKARSDQIAQLIAQNDSDELTNQEVREQREKVRTCKYNLMQASVPPCDPQPLLSQPTASPSK